MNGYQSVAFKIWIIALIANAVSGTACLIHSREDMNGADSFFAVVFFVGLIFSTPAFALLLFILKWSIKRKKLGKVMFINTLVSGIILLLIPYGLFFFLFDFAPFIFCGIFSIIAAISSQYKYLIHLGQPAFSAHH